MSQPAASFSYAQAAKTVSPAIPTVPTYERSRRDSMEANPVGEASMHNDQPIQAPLELPNGHVLGNGYFTHGSSAKKSLVVTPKRITNNHVVSSLHSTEEVSRPTADIPAPTPPSPNLSSVSTSTLPKEEGISATPNASSDSTWEKQSQASQIDEKPSETGLENVGGKEGEKTTEGASDKSEEEKVESPSAVWDQLAASSQLKDAPLPAFNIWQQRALDQKAKASKDTKPIVKSTVATKPGLPPGSQDGYNSLKDDQRYARGRKDSHGPSQFEHVNGHRASKDFNLLNQSLHDFRPMESNPSSMVPLPPSTDAVSWPTPDTAKDEERRKVQDKAEKQEKDKGSTARPHGKGKWVPVPYVPTAVFNTPLPPSRRGGRMPRGGRGDARGGHFSHSSISGEKSFSGGQTSAASPQTSSSTSAPAERGRGDMGPPPVPKGALANRGRRPNSTGPHFTQEEVRTLDFAAEEQTTDVRPSVLRFDSQDPQTDATSRRIIPNATQVNYLEGRRQSSPSNHNASHVAGRRLVQGEANHEVRPPSVTNENAQSRIGGPERKGDNAFGQYEGFREPYFGHREGRPERGRGGYRGRGGANGFHGNPLPNGVHANGAPSNHVNSGLPPRPYPYGDRQSSLPNSTSFNPSRREPGSYRPNSRSHSITSPPPAHNRFPSGINPQNPQLPALQTHLANAYGYEVTNPGIMTAVPYYPFMETAAQQLFGMISMQMEYYFSVGNLCRDTFLRQHMDSQGFVFLTVLTNFNRIKQLTSDAQLVRMVCACAPSIEFRTGLDGLDRVRKSEDWEHWVLDPTQRDPSVQSPTPVELQPPQMPQYDITAAPYPYGQITGPWMDPGVQQPGWARSEEPNGHGLDGTVPSFYPAASKRQSFGTIEKASNNGPMTSTPLSAAVPEFSPNPTFPNHEGDNPVNPSSSLESVFSDERVQSLTLVIRDKRASAIPPRGPRFARASSRTFFNGSVDENTSLDSIAAMGENPTEDVSHTTAINQDSIFSSHSSEMISYESMQSPQPQEHPLKRLACNPHRVFWVKDREFLITDLLEEFTHAFYVDFREDALRKRETVPIGQCHRDMSILYTFWSHFLIRNFNLRMYEEFRQLAYDDAIRRFDNIGFTSLIDYYNVSILGVAAIADELVRDYVELVQVGTAREDTTAHDKLRSAWRNGLMNLQNRKTLDKVADSALIADLDR